MIGDSYKCKCGNVIELDEFLRDVERNAFDDGDAAWLESEFECYECGATYAIEAEASIYISSSIVSVECTQEAAILEGINFTDVMIGDSVEIPDGTYEVGSNQYLIESGVLTAIFSSLVDACQLQLQI